MSNTNLTLKPVGNLWCLGMIIRSYSACDNRRVAYVSTNPVISVT